MVKLNDSGLFLAKQDGENYAVSAELIKEYIHTGNLDTELMVQLRDYFTFDADDKAIIPDEAFYADDVNDVYYARPGVWWQASDYDPSNPNYDPKTLTHLFCVGARYRELEQPDGSYTYNDATIMPVFEVGDIVHVQAKALDFTLYSNNPEDHDAYGHAFNNVWRVVEKVDVVDPNNVVPNWFNVGNTMNCYRVEKCVRETQYDGRYWYVNADDPVDGKVIIPARVNHWFMSDEFVMKSGDTMSGKLVLDMDQPDSSNENGFVIRGRIKDDAGVLGTGVLFKDYRREDASTSSDYVAYYGSEGGEYEIVNRKTLDEQTNILQNEVLELEEEISAIARSIDRGSWEWALTVSNYLDPLPAGKFYMVDGNNGLAVTTDYVNATKIVFHNFDSEGDEHTFNADMVDKVLMLFDRPDDDFIESIVTAVDNPVGQDYAIIDITHVQSKGSPTNSADTDGKYKARLNIFEAPTGGDVGEYVLKIGGDTGGKMSGYLDIDMSANGPGSTNPDGSGKQSRLLMKGDRTGITNPVCTIEFSNVSSNRPGTFSYYSSDTNDEEHFKFDRNIKFSNCDLTSIQNLSLTGPGYIQCNGVNSIRFKSDPGNGNNGSGYIQVERPGANDRRGLTIRGKNTSNTEVDVLYTKTHSSGGDGVYYVGRQNSGTDQLATVKFVENKLDFSQYTELQP